MRLIDLQNILGPYRYIQNSRNMTCHSLLSMFSSIASFKFYDDDKLAVVCSNTADLNSANTTETTIFNKNHQSNFMIVSIKSSIDSQTIDFIGNNTNIILLYPLKDVPSKLTVDGRRNLIAVVCISSCHLQERFTFILISNHLSFENLIY